MMAGRFVQSATPLEGLMVLERQPISDARGFLERLFCARDLKEAGVDWLPVQANRTLTLKKATVRGLHYQRAPNAEAKLVCCLRGRVFDVAVDLRRGSPTLLHWHGQELSERNARMMLIPRGFAHGFQTLSDNCELLYFHSDYHEPAAEAGINVSDKQIAIDWPLPIGEISERDLGLPMARGQYEGERA